MKRTNADDSASSLWLYRRIGGYDVIAAVIDDLFAGHTDRTVEQQTLPEALEYLWHGYSAAETKP